MNSLSLAVECHNKGLLSKEAMDRVTQVRERLVKEAMRRQAQMFVDALMSPEEGEKLAGVGDFFSKTRKATARASSPNKMGEAVGRLGRMLALAGLTAGAGAGINALQTHSKDKKLKARIEDSYRQMLKEFPQLQELNERKNGVAQRHFGVIARYAPSLAAEPVVAGTMIKSTATSDYIEPAMIKQLAETQMAIDKSREGKALFPPGHFRNVVGIASAAMPKG